MTKTSFGRREATFLYLGHEMRLFEGTDGYCYYVMKIDGEVIRSHFYNDSPSALAGAKERIDKYEAAKLTEYE
jgi:hypothetical protein